MAQERMDYDSRRAMKVQLSRLFGTNFKQATSLPQSNAQWRNTLKQVLREIQRYLEANADTDEFHMQILYSGLVGASEALKQEEFWPGYAEGITRTLLILLADYPNHRRRKTGRKDRDFYKLNLNRTVHWNQTPEQRFRTLMQAGEAGFPVLSQRPFDVLGQFREKFGYRADHTVFLEWYRRNFPEDYAAIFR